MRNDGMTARMVKRVLQIPTGPRLLLGSAASAIPFYVAAFLSYSVSQAAHFGGAMTLAVHAAVFLVLLTAATFAARYISAVSHMMKQAEQARVALRLHAYAFLDRLVCRDVCRVDDTGALEERFVERFLATKSSLQELVEAAYAAFEAAYSQTVASEERVDFEVTFMTKSYVDQCITIPACANRDGRAPRSMILRQQQNDIYDNTVTAVVYREKRPSVRIIEDTLDPKANYQELYPDQNRRIRSSIVYPVLSDTNELLGTLVVHCDHAGFFRLAEEKYWTDVLEIFAKRLALVKLKLDKLARFVAAGSVELRVAVEPLAF